MSVDPDQFLYFVRHPLARGDATALAQAVLARWKPAELCPLLSCPDVDVRRVAAVVLGLVGGRSCVDCLAQALHDPDHQVNQMAEHGLWAIWFRLGDPQAAKPFQEGVTLLAAESYAGAIRRFERAIAVDPSFAEAYNQCAIAHFLLGQWQASLEDARMAVERMPVHFGAMAGMGHCYAHLGDLNQALACYRRALAINPQMHAIAQAVERLQGKLQCDAAPSLTTSKPPRSI